jgi:acyl phosphate:glycerol-3-phosphate acyltransferase
MSLDWIIAALVAAAYLLGAIPSAYLIARTRGVDIRKVGSGNVGATNVFRSVSKGLGIVTFVADVLKGFVPAFVFPRLAAALVHGTAADVGQLPAVLFAAAAVAGHNWPVYLRFKGGKGVATSAGALLGMAPAAAGLGVLVWAAVFAGSRYVSVASIAAAVLVAAAAWWLYRGAGLVLPVALTILSLVIIWRHKSNIQRLAAGTEHRFGKRKQTAEKQG